MESGSSGQEGHLVVPIRSGAIVSSAIARSLVVFVFVSVICLGAAKGGDIKRLGAVWIAFVIIVVALTWFTARRLVGATLVIGTEGIELQTRKGISGLSWRDMTAVAFEYVDGYTMLLCAIKPGVEVPASVLMDIPRWYPELRCVHLVNLEALDVNVDELSEALWRYGNGVFRRDGGLGSEGGG